MRRLRLFIILMLFTLTLLKSNETEAAISKIGILAFPGFLTSDDRPH